MIHYDSVLDIMTDFSSIVRFVAGSYFAIGNGIHMVFFDTVQYSRRADMVCKRVKAVSAIHSA